MWKISVFFFCLWCVTTAYDWRQYERHELIQITPQTREQLDLVLELEESYNLDVWSEARLKHPVSILVAPDDLTQVKHELSRSRLAYSVVESTLMEDMFAEWDRIENLEHQAAFNYSDFNDFNTTIDELDNMAATCVTGFTCTVSTLGYTYEGRPVNMMKMSQGSGRRAVWIDSQIHAREWLASATTMNIFRKMMTEYGTNPEATFLLDNWDWYFLPIMNPDGYHRTWVDDRLWRKNMSPNNDSNCPGTDLNRNYDYNWGDPGASAVPCSFTYHGASPASEFETQAVQNQVTPTADTIDAFWTVHTYGQYFLEPIGNCTLPPEFDDIRRVTDVTCTAFENTYGTVWDCGNSCEVLYRTSGTTSDWSYGAGIVYSWTVELRGVGFVVPPSDIELSYTEVWNGLYAMMTEINASKQKNN